MRSDRERLEDIVEACDLIEGSIGHRRHDLATDAVLQAAAQRWIEVIGEAAAGLSEQLRDSHPDVPWRSAIGMRNILAHGYFDIDVALIGNVVERDMPALRAQVSRILAELE